MRVLASCLKLWWIAALALTACSAAAVSMPAVAPAAPAPVTKNSLQFVEFYSPL